MNKIIKYFSVFALSAFCLIACNKSSDAKNLYSANAAQPSPSVYDISDVKSLGTNKAVDFSWTDNGKKYSFSDVSKGKVVFLNFWGTWCPPCRAEIPDIIELNSELSSKGLLVMGMASERPGTDAMNKVKEFASSKKINYLNFISNNQIRELYGGIQFVPTTFIIDREGNIVEVINGMKRKQEFLDIINKYL